MDGLILTRDTLLRFAGIVPVREVRRSHRAIKQAHQALTPAGAADHAARLRAADLNLKLVDAYPKDSVVSDPSRPVAVNIILDGATNGAGPALSSHGVTLHLTEHHGDGA